MPLSVDTDESTVYSPVTQASPAVDDAQPVETQMNPTEEEEEIDLTSLDDEELDDEAAEGTVMLSEDGSVSIVKEEGATATQAAINTFISFVGAGILGLPGAFKTTGLVLGSCLMGTVALLAYVAMMMLLSSKKLLREQKVDNCNTYGDLSYIAFGRLGFTVVQSALLITQTGFCCSYVIYITEAADQLLHVNKNLVALVVVGCVLPLILLKHLKYLSWTSLMANVMNCSAFGVVYLFDASSMMDHGLPEIHAFNHTGILYFLGVAVYCYEGIGLVLPLEASMEEREAFPWVLKSSMFAVTALFTSFGVVGYMAYGDNTEGLITENLPGGAITQILRVVLAIGLFFTYPIMMFPVSQILDDLAIDMRQGQHPVKQNLIRLLLAVITGIVARSVPDFGLFISLVGSSCCALLAFVMPAAIHLSVHKEQISNSAALVDIVVICFGSMMGILGTYKSVLDIIAAVNGEVVAGGHGG